MRRSKGIFIRKASPPDEMDDEELVSELRRRPRHYTDIAGMYISHEIDLLAELFLKHEAMPSLVSVVDNRPRHSASVYATYIDELCARAKRLV